MNASPQSCAQNDCFKVPQPTRGAKLLAPYNAKTRRHTMNKKGITRKLQLNKETLRNLLERDLRVAVGGASMIESCKSDCWCVSDGSCPPSLRCGTTTTG